MSDYIELHNISKTYNGVKVLDIGYYKIPLDGIVAIIGFSGNGKTTLLNIMGLLDVPDPTEEAKIVYKIGEERYEVTFLSKKISILKGNISIDSNQFRRDFFGFVFQENMLHPSLTPQNNVLMPLQINDLGYDGEVDTLFEEIGVDPQHSKSGGQKQRIAILRGMVKNPKVMFADEPTSSLDLPRAAQALEAFKRYHTIWITHDMLLAEKFADYIIVIEGGHLCPLKENKEDFSLLEVLRVGCKKKKPLETSTIDVKSTQPHTWREKVSFIFEYAQKDLLWPQKDFWTLLSILLISFISLLSIFSVQFNLNTIINTHLTDPRVSYIQVLEDSAVGNFDNKDFEQFKVVISKHPDLKGKCKISKLKTAIVSFKKQHSMAHLTLSTFEKDDPLFEKMLEAGALKLNGIDIRKTLQPHPIWIEKNLNFVVLGKEAQFQHDIKEQETTKLGKMEKEMHLIYADRDLPFGQDLFIRDAFFDTLFPEYPLENFSMIFYPQDIETSLKLLEWLKKGKNSGSIIETKFYIDQETDKYNSLKLIYTIEYIVSVMLGVIIFAVVALLLFIMAVNIYSNIKQKSKALGIMLAFGMPKWYFFAFYMMKALLLGSIAILGSFLFFSMLVEPLLQGYLQEELFSNLLAIAKSGMGSAVAVDLPWVEYLKTFGLGMVFVSVMFLGFVFFRVVSRVPSSLLKGESI